MFVQRVVAVPVNQTDNAKKNMELQSVNSIRFGPGKDAELKKLSIELTTSIKNILCTLLISIKNFCDKKSQDLTNM